MPISPEKNVRLRGAVQSFVVTPDDPDTTFFFPIVRIDVAFDGYQVGDILKFDFENSVWVVDPDFLLEDVRSQDELDALLDLDEIPLARVATAFEPYEFNDDLRYNRTSEMWEDAKDITIVPVDEDTQFDILVRDKLLTVHDVSVLDENGNNVGILSNFKLSDDCREVGFDVTLPIGDGIVRVMVIAMGVEGIAVDLVSRITLIKYLWADQETIQSYLDGEGSIQIRDDDGAEADDVTKNFAQATAIRLENESVFEIATLLSMVFESDMSSDYVPDTPATVNTPLEQGVYSETPLGYKAEIDTVSPGTFCSWYLCLLVGRLTAAKIATVRLGASLSTLPNWVRAYKNEVYAQLQRWAVNAETAEIKGLTVRGDYDLANVLLKMKTREHTAEDLEN